LDPLVIIALLTDAPASSSAAFTIIDEDAELPLV